MHPTPRQSTAGFTLIELLTVIAIIGILAAIFIPTIGSALDKAKRAVDGANLREIVKAAMIYAQDNSDKLPDPQNITAQTLNANSRALLWPGIIARNGILTDPKVYYSKLDPFFSGTYPISIILSTLAANAAKNQLDQTFLRESPSYEFVGGLKTSDPSTTPVAYTRGLQANTGNWSINSGVYKDIGGFVGFLGGNVEFYSSAATPAAIFTSNNSGRKIQNIQQAIPTTARLYGVPPNGPGAGTILGSANGTLAQRGP
ncbi:MAG: prepilin-type N-terminal cleavage/methylation domain-containing protein [Opitutus sp.]|nr:prepilin-type N-terminal cleavage/methylation domain-containing protein [Opitutus sp.]